jgi:FemAB-related protein (PEP-CTERM system-associated)
VTDSSETVLRVGELGEADADRWDAFVADCPEATFFHRAGWKAVVEQSFGHRTHFLYAERQGRIVGVLPLVHVKSRLFGNALISSAFAVYGGPAVVEEGAREALDARAIQLAELLQVDHLEYRCRTAVRPDWACKSDLYVTFRKAISRDPDENMKAIPRKQRAMVRKGIKAGLQTENDDQVDRLHHIYAVSVRNLGTPVFPKSYFRNLKKTFGKDCEVLTITHDGAAVASVMNFYFRDEVLPYYGGGTDGARPVAANDFMYWEVMRRAAEQGCRLFDFGRSKAGTGSYAFKKHWGFEPEPLHYEFYLRGAASIPDVNPLNPKYRLFIQAWQRLPLPVSKLIGPLVVRNLG